MTYLIMTLFLKSGTTADSNKITKEQEGILVWFDRKKWNDKE